MDIDIKRNAVFLEFIHTLVDYLDDKSTIEMLREKAKAVDSIQGGDATYPTNIVPYLEIIIDLLRKGDTKAWEWLKKSINDEEMLIRLKEVSAQYLSN